MQSPEFLSVGAFARRNINERAVKSTILGGLVALFSMMLMATTLVSAHLEKGLASLSARLGADVLVVPQGEAKKLQGALLRAEPSSFYIDAQIGQTLQHLPGVEAVTGQFFVSSLNAQCCTVKVQLIGIDEATDFVVKPWLDQALHRPLTDHEVIVGDYIVGDVGSHVKFYDQDFVIAARLAPTGMGFDASVFMNQAAARRLALVANPEKRDVITSGVSAFLVKVAPGVDPITVSDGLLDALGLKANVNFIFANHLMSDTASKLTRLVDVLRIACAVLWVFAAIVLFMMYFNSYHAREREMGVLRALGATRGYLMQLIAIETLTLSGVGAIVGTALGAVAVYLVGALGAQSLGLPYLNPGLTSWLQCAMVALITGTLTAPLAAWPIFYRMMRRNVAQSIAQGGL